MINILIPSIDNKFYRNLSITKIPNVNIITQNIRGNIYNLYYKYQFNILILPSSLIDNSILQFCVEYMNNVKIILDIDSKLDPEFIDTYKNIFVFLTNSNDTILYKKYKHIEKPSNVINDQLYHQNMSIAKHNFIACFLDNMIELPTQLLNHLYPNNTVKIRMFNSSHIHHPQNLGLVNEIDKASILQNAEYYLDINSSIYNIEANISQCKIINLDSINKLEPINFDTPQYTTYDQLIQDCIII